MVDVGTTLEMVQASQAGMSAVGAGLAVGLTGVGTGLAEMGIGAAAVGATAENRDMFGLALLFTVIPETIVIFGLVVALLLLF
ncbi:MULTISPECIES: ATPase [unclassified Methanoculleus]|jgi:V/A-type H+-transporting ATPase subunit K|uniref:ATPase n=1 Tax=Methanoculleus palmolei TaxID=72612 RepID=A0ABD8A5V4_9EURY|nr:MULTISPECIES: ATPase [unclassified Methanoculleus]WOX54862.1 ATPase [Methanoculleus palmolei]